jgi:hypothetical protein
VLGRIFGDARARRAGILRAGISRPIVPPDADAHNFRVPADKYKKIRDFFDICLPFVPEMLYNTDKGAQS